MNLENRRNGPEYKQLEVLRRVNKNTNKIKQHLWDSVNTVNPLQTQFEIEKIKKNNEPRDVEDLPKELSHLEIGT